MNCFLFLPLQRTSALLAYETLSCSKRIEREREQEPSHTHTHTHIYSKRPWHDAGLFPIKVTLTTTSFLFLRFSFSLCMLFFLFFFFYRLNMSIMILCCCFWCFFCSHLIRTFHRKSYRKRINEELLFKISRQIIDSIYFLVDMYIINYDYIYQHIVCSSRFLLFSLSLSLFFLLSFSRSMNLYLIALAKLIILHVCVHVIISS